jgi:hypothetical protein
MTIAIQTRAMTSKQLPLLHRRHRHYHELPKRTWLCFFNPLKRELDQKVCHTHHHTHTHTHTHIRANITYRTNSIGLMILVAEARKADERFRQAYESGISSDIDVNVDADDSTRSALSGKQLRNEIESKSLLYQYLSLSPHCAEVFQIWDSITSDRGSRLHAKIYDALTAILEHNFYYSTRSVSTFLCRQVLCLVACSARSWCGRCIDVASGVSR